MHKESRHRLGNDEVLQAEYKSHPHTVLWTPNVLALVEMILRPPEGGPPSFPEDSDAVFLPLALLNSFYKFSYNSEFSMFDIPIYYARYYFMSISFKSKIAIPSKDMFYNSLAVPQLGMLCLLSTRIGLVQP